MGSLTVFLIPVVSLHLFVLKSHCLLPSPVGPILVTSELKAVLCTSEPPEIPLNEWMSGNREQEVRGRQITKLKTERTDHPG